MSNSGGIEAVLRPYGDAEVTGAVRKICRDIRAGSPVRSPFGVLYVAARDGNDDYFGAATDEAVVVSHGSNLGVDEGDGKETSEPLSRAEVLKRLSSVRSGLG